MERFPVSLIQEPTAFMSNDSMEIYNNILVFIVGDERQLNNSQSEMHIFQVDFDINNFIKITTSNIDNEIRVLIKNIAVEYLKIKHALLEHWLNQKMLLIS